MRSQFLVPAAIAVVGVCFWFTSVAQARPPADSAKGGTKKAAELHADEKSMKKQLQWEDNVMGPDSKRAELAKIARAHAINEKAEKEKERQAALEATAPALKVAPANKKNEKAEVAIPSTSAPEKNERDANRPHDISPKLATEAAQVPPPPLKPADDKFIDKLLHEEDAPSKKHASASDRELDSLLSGAQEKPKSTDRRRGDSVDDLIKSADKGPAMPAPRAQSGGLPEWAKQPEIASTSTSATVSTKASARNTGVIQVVQGAVGPAPAIVPARAAPASARGGRKAAASKPPVAWSDPFADKKAVASSQTPKKEAASRPASSTESSWNDPFADTGETRKSARRAAPTAAPSSPPKRRDSDKSEPSTRPSGGGGNDRWKDPFTRAPTESARAPAVAMRDLGPRESSKWEIARRGPATSHAPAPERHATSWAVIKKRAR
ncbi:MAG TPA: hypothetical protein VG319_07240 [Polyangia bacterium]|jgi:hypothetical protein|nr:hypothetical protein [Polyangia bacterium]